MRLTQEQFESQFTRRLDDDWAQKALEQKVIVPDQSGPFSCFRALDKILVLKSDNHFYMH